MFKVGFKLFNVKPQTVSWIRQCMQLCAGAGVESLGQYLNPHFRLFSGIIMLAIKILKIKEKTSGS